MKSSPVVTQSSTAPKMAAANKQNNQIDLIKKTMAQLENEDVQVNSIKEIENILTKEAKQRSIVPQIDK